MGGKLRRKKGLKKLSLGRLRDPISKSPHGVYLDSVAIAIRSGGEVMNHFFTSLIFIRLRIM
jgi:hypothetical protein